MRTVMLLVAALGVIHADVIAQNKREIPANQMAWWAASWNKALEAAADRNVPIVIVVIQDGEEANERLAAGLLRDPQFIAACDDCVPIVCSKKDHGNTQQKTLLGKRAVCSKFGEVPCELHVAHEAHMFRELFAGKTVKTPQVMFCTPDLEVVDEIIDVAGTPAYLSALQKAKRRVGPGLGREAYEAAKLAITRGRNLLKQEKLREAWDACAETVAVGGESRLVKEAREIRATVTREVESTLKSAFAAAEAQNLWDAIPALKDVSEAFDGTALGERAEDAFKRLARTREGRAVVRGLRKQKRYEPWLERAQRYEGKNDFVRARDVYRRIIDKAEGLPIAAKAEKRLAVYAADPDIKALLEAADREREASDLLEKARKHEKEGRHDEAKKLREKIKKDYPGTRAAKRLEND